MKTIDCFY